MVRRLRIFTGLSLFVAVLIFANWLESLKDQSVTRHDFELSISYLNLAKIQYYAGVPSQNEIKAKLKTPLFHKKVLVRSLKYSEGPEYILNLLFEEEPFVHTSYRLLPAKYISADDLHMINQSAQRERRMQKGLLSLNGKSLGEYILIEELDEFYALKMNQGQGKISRKILNSKWEQVVDHIDQTQKDIILGNDLLL